MALLTFLTTRKLILFERIATHQWPQHFGKNHSAIFGLVLLHNRDDNSRHSTGGAIHGVHVILVNIHYIEICFIEIKFVVCDVEPFRLVIGAVGRGRYFAPIVTA